MSLAAWLMLVASVWPRWISWERDAMFPGALATSSKPAQKSASWAWMPVSLGSLKASSTRLRIDCERPSWEFVACSVSDRAWRNSSMVRNVPTTATPEPAPSERACTAATVGLPMVAISTRWRE
jgi:hypothetical protein